MATLFAKGQLPLHQDFVHEGILGTTFTGRLIARDEGGAVSAAVTPTISGRAWITGMANYVVDADDPFPTGFTVGDIWGASELSVGMVANPNRRRQVYIVYYRSVAPYSLRYLSQAVLQEASRNQ